MKNSPWGKIDYINPVALDVVSVGTASHGGLKLSRKLNALMPDYIKREGGWYEEDCEWCLPFVVLEEHFRRTGTPKTLEIIAKGNHKRTFAAYYWKEYECFYGVVLQPGESREKEKELWKEAHRNDWQSVTGYGDWHPRVPKGMVARACTLGGNRGGERRVFLLSAEENKARVGTFIPDFSRHEEISAGDM